MIPRKTGIAKWLEQASFVARPRFWLRNEPYSAAWDAALNAMLDDPKIETRGSHTLLLNGKDIWVRNYPYSYGHPYEWAHEVMPSRATVIRLHKTIEQHWFGTPP